MMAKSFNLTCNVDIIWQIDKTPAMINAEKRFIRDCLKTLTDIDISKSIVKITCDESLKAEQWKISVDEKSIQVYASEELGVVYALIFISSEFLGVEPFWFWNDQHFEKKNISIPFGIYESKPYAVKFRGWFVNDEVLINEWKADKDNKYVWEMVFEALLRLGGNMVIPGTDHNSRKNRQMACDMGLWITHHHAEPLGAEMFARKYPGYEASYRKYPKLFQKLWEDAIDEQQSMKVIWNLGFRGQGDAAFWNYDSSYDTSEKRGELISQLISLQYNMVLSKIDKPVFCTNLYGEIMELYKDGYITLPEDIIYIWADNGYGKMVTRRQENKNLRVPALPGRNGEMVTAKHHGIYYHVSFYDLQAASHITMLSNSPKFIGQELSEVYKTGADDFWIINCSNVKPHTYMLDLIAELWTLHGKNNLLSDDDSVDNICKKYIGTYFKDNTDRVYGCYKLYHDSMIQYGDNDDDKAGDQFYSWVTRALVSGWMLDETKPVDEIASWATGDIPLGRQIEWYYDRIMSGREKIRALYNECGEVAKLLGKDDKQLFNDSIYLQSKIHYYCAEGSVMFCQAYFKWKSKDYAESFYLLGNAAEMFRKADSSMRSCEHDKWKGFYKNECFSNVKFTSYFIEQLMFKVRLMGDGSRMYKWYKKYMGPEEDREIGLLLYLENNPTDEEMYEGMKKYISNGNSL